MDNSSRRKGKNPIPYHHDMRKERNKKLYGTKHHGHNSYTKTGTEQLINIIPPV